MVDCGTAKGAVILRFACPSSLTPVTTSSDKKKPSRSSRNLRFVTSTTGSMRGRFVEGGIKEERCDQNTAIYLHTFSDLCHTAPPVFIYLLKEGYIHGTLKATRKFKVLQQQVSLAFLNSPTVSADLFIIQCLYLLPFFESAYTEGFSHLLLSCLCRVRKLPDITSEAKSLASKLFVYDIYGSRTHEDRILVRLLIIFNVRLEDIVRAMPDQGGDMDGLDMANSCIEQFIFELIGKKFYKMAVDLLEHLSIYKFEEHFLYKMIEDHKFSAAEKWATFMGKPMLYLLVEKYLEMKMVKLAYGVIKTNDLAEEFPHVRRLYKETSIKKLAERGCWDVAEMRTDGDSELIEFLIYLAMEAGYNEKVDEISNRYSLSGFKKLDGAVTEGHFQNLRFLRSAELISEGILWVDNVADMERATNYIEDCKLVGLDCEWKPNYEKGSRPNKVSIIQIASERRAYIFDMIKLHTDAPSLLNSCLKRILHSSRILKLGYNFKCDIHQLSSSYVDLECLKYYERLLDIQALFNDRCGGLSGVAEKVLGAGLNKTRRNSNWEQRPLSANQLEYAALDASVLVHIFCRFNSQSQIPNSDEQKNLKVEWKSHIVSRMS